MHAKPSALCLLNDHKIRNERGDLRGRFAGLARKANRRQIAPLLSVLAREGFVRRSEISPKTLELGRFSEVEVADFHRGHDHVHRLLATGASRLTHRFDILQHVYRTFIEAEVAYSCLYLAALDQECAVRVMPVSIFS